jgi:hypothetical protein
MGERKPDSMADAKQKIHLCSVSSESPMQNQSLTPQNSGISASVTDDSQRTGTSIIYIEKGFTLY